MPFHFAPARLAGPSLARPTLTREELSRIFARELGHAVPTFRAA